MKRLFDIIFSIIGIIILFPLMLVIAISIKLFSNTPILFIQERIGINECKFYLYKFCTMKEKEDKNEVHLTIRSNPRITSVGKILRKWKLDEIPSLFNVFKGDMSFVGPRPWVKYYIDKLSESDKLFLKIRPGITSPATLKYANEEYLLLNKDNPEEFHNMHILPDKVRLNLLYLNDHSLLKDIIIILKTIFRQNY